VNVAEGPEEIVGAEVVGAVTERVKPTEAFGETPLLAVTVME
jgi:hypothetical protein